MRVPRGEDDGAGEVGVLSSESSGVVEDVGEDGVREGVDVDGRGDAEDGFLCW